MNDPTVGDVQRAILKLREDGCRPTALRFALETHDTIKPGFGGMYLFGLPIIVAAAEGADEVIGADGDGHEHRVPIIQSEPA